MLPLTPFDGHTKRFTRDMLDPAQGAMVDWFFPDFFRKKTDDELRAERERPPLRDADYIARNPDPPRRYAPSPGSPAALHYNFPRSCFAMTSSCMCVVPS